MAKRVYYSEELPNTQEPAVRVSDDYVTPYKGQPVKEDPLIKLGEALGGLSKGLSMLHEANAPEREEEAIKFVQRHEELQDYDPPSGPITDFFRDQVEWKLKADELAMARFSRGEDTGSFQFTRDGVKYWAEGQAQRYNLALTEALSERQQDASLARDLDSDEIKAIANKVEKEVLGQFSDEVQGNVYFRAKISSTSDVAKSRWWEAVVGEHNKARYEEARESFAEELSDKVAEIEWQDPKAAVEGLNLLTNNYYKAFLAERGKGLPELHLDEESIGKMILTALQGHITTLKGNKEWDELAALAELAEQSNSPFKQLKGFGEADRERLTALIQAARDSEASSAQKSRELSASAGKYVEIWDDLSDEELKLVGGFEAGLTEYLKNKGYSDDAIKLEGIAFGNAALKSYMEDREDREWVLSQRELAAQDRALQAEDRIQRNQDNTVRDAQATLRGKVNVGRSEMYEYIKTLGLPKGHEDALKAFARGVLAARETAKKDLSAFMLTPEARNAIVPVSSDLIGQIAVAMAALQAAQDSEDNDGIQAASDAHARLGSYQAALKLGFADAAVGGMEEWVVINGQPQDSNEEALMRAAGLTAANTWLEGTFMPDFKKEYPEPAPPPPLSASQIRATIPEEEQTPEQRLQVGELEGADEARAKSADSLRRGRTAKGGGPWWSDVTYNLDGLLGESRVGAGAHSVDFSAGELAARVDRSDGARLDGKGLVGLLRDMISLRAVSGGEDLLSNTAWVEKVEQLEYEKDVQQAVLSAELLRFKEDPTRYAIPERLLAMAQMGVTGEQPNLDAAHRGLTLDEISSGRIQVGGHTVEVNPVHINPAMFALWDSVEELSAASDEDVQKVIDALNPKVVARITQYAEAEKKTVTYVVRAAQTIFLTEKLMFDPPVFIPKADEVPETPPNTEEK